MPLRPDWRSGNDRPRVGAIDLCRLLSTETMDSKFLRSMTVSTLSTKGGDIDLLAEPEGIDHFEGLWSRAVEMDVFGKMIRVASLEDLVGMKKAAEGFGGP